MKKFLLTLSALSMALFFIGCSENETDGVKTYPDAVVELTAGEATFESLSFTLETSEASEVAWTIQKSDATAPDAAAVLANGTKVEANKTLNLKAEALEAETAYTIYAAANNADKSKATLATVEMTTVAAPVVPEATGKIEIKDDEITETKITFYVTTENVVAASYNVVASELVTDEITAELILSEEGGYPLGEEELNTTVSLIQRRGVQAATEYTIFLAYKGEGEDAEAKMVSATVTTPGSPAPAPANIIFEATEIDIFVDDLYGETIVTMVGEEYKLSVTLNVANSSELVNKEFFTAPAEGEVGILAANIMNLDNSAVDGVEIANGLLSIMESQTTEGAYLVDAWFMTTTESEVAATYEGAIEGLKPIVVEAPVVDFTVAKATVARSEDYAEDASVWYLELTSAEGYMVGLTIDTSMDDAPILIGAPYPVVQGVGTTYGIDQFTSWVDMGEYGGGGLSIVEGEALTIQTMYDGVNAETDKYTFNGKLSNFNMISGGVDFKINFITPEDKFFALYPQPEPELPVEEVALKANQFVQYGYFEKVAEGNYRFFNDKFEFNVFIQGEITTTATEFSVEAGTLLTTSTMTVKVDGLNAPVGTYTLRSGAVKIQDRGNNKITFKPAASSSNVTVWRQTTTEKHIDATCKETMGQSCQSISISETGKETLAITGCNVAVTDDVANIAQIKYTLADGEMTATVSPYTMGDGVYTFDLANSSYEKFVNTPQTFLVAGGNIKFLPSAANTLTINGTVHTLSALAVNGTRYEFTYDTAAVEEEITEITVTPTRFETSFTEEGFQLIAEDDDLNKLTLAGSYNLGETYFPSGLYGFFKDADTAALDQDYDEWFDMTKTSIYYNSANYTIKEDSQTNDENAVQIQTSMPDADTNVLKISFIGTSTDGVKRKFIINYEGALGYEMSAPEKPIETATKNLYASGYSVYKYENGNEVNLRFVCPGKHDVNLFFTPADGVIPTTETQYSVADGTLLTKSTYTDLTTNITYTLSAGTFGIRDKGMGNYSFKAIKVDDAFPVFRYDAGDKFVDLTTNTSSMALSAVLANPVETSVQELVVTGISAQDYDTQAQVTVSLEAGSMQLMLYPGGLNNGTYTFDSTKEPYVLAKSSMYYDGDNKKHSFVEAEPSSSLTIQDGVYTLNALLADGLRVKFSYTDPNWAPTPEVETQTYNLVPDAISIYPSEDTAGALTLEVAQGSDFFIFDITVPGQQLTYIPYPGIGQVYMGTPDFMGMYGVAYANTNISYAWIDGKGYDLLADTTDYYIYLGSNYDGVDASTDVIQFAGMFLTAGKEYAIQCGSCEYTGAHTGGSASTEPVTIEFEPTMVVCSQFDDTDWKIEAMDEAGYYYSFYIKQAATGTSIANGYYYIGKTAPCLHADYTCVYDAQYNEYYFAEGSGVAISTEWDADGNEVSTSFTGKLVSTDGMLTINIDYTGKIYNSAIGGGPELM